MLPNLGNTKTVDNVKQKVSGLTENIRPTKLAASAFSSVKTTLASEVPEVTGLIDTVSSITNDIVSDVKDMFKKTEQSNKQVVSQVKSSSESNDSMLENIALWLEKVDSNLHGSPPYLMTTVEKLEEINSELQLNNELTKNAWEISDRQFDLMKQMLAFEQNNAKLSKFDQQKEEAQDILAPAMTSTGNTKKAGGSKFLFFGPAMEFVKTVLAGLGGIFTSILAATGISKLLKMLKFRNAAKVGKSFALATGKTISLIEKVLKPMKAIGKFAGVFGKTLLKFTGIGSLLISVVDGVIGAVKGAVKAFKNDENVLIGAVKGAFFQIGQGFTDAGVMIANLFGANIKDVNFEELVTNTLKSLGKIWDTFSEGVVRDVTSTMDKYAEVGGKLWTKVTNVWDSTSDSFSQMKGMLGERFEITKKRFFDFFKFITDLPKKLLNMATDILPDKMKKVVSKGMNIIDETIIQPVATVTELAKDIKINQESVNRVITKSAIQPIEAINSLIPQIAENKSTYAPVNNVTNTMVVPSNIRTRNPESPVFMSDKVMQ